MMVGVMRPEEHSYANYDADHYFENTIVLVGESSPQNKKIDEKGSEPLNSGSFIWTLLNERHYYK